MSEQSIQQAQLAMVVGHARSSRRIKVAFILITFFMLVGRTEPWTLWFWLSMNMIAAIARETLDYRYSTRRLTDPVVTFRWFRRILVFDGFSFGMLGFLVSPSPDGPLALMLLAVVIGAAAISFVVLHAHYSLMLSYVLPSLVPNLIWQFVRPGELGVYMGIASTCFTVLIVLEGWRGYSNIRELLRRRFEMSELAAQREAALEQAKQVAQSKSQFLAVMSHELRTPLHGMLGIAELLKRESATMPAAVRDANVDSLYLTGQHLLSVVNHVLDFAKMKDDPIQLQPAAFELVSMLQAVADISRVLADAKRLSLQLRCTFAAPRWVDADEARLRQVLLNIVGNAIKFTERGGVTIDVAETFVHRYRIDVRDTGVGVSAHDLERIFEPFEQADASYGRRFGGTGLGLSISRELARAMGGDLTASSIPGEGSCFTLEVMLPAAPGAITTSAVPAAAAPVIAATSPAATIHGLMMPGALPAAAPSAASADARPAEEESPAAQPAQYAGRVLLAEDNRLSAFVVAKLLRRFGIEVDVAGTGQDAIDMSEHVPYSMILMDCQMPGVDGFEATRRIRSRELAHELPRTAIIAMTANALQGDRERCLAAGMDDYLAKPFGERELVRALGPLLRRDDKLAAPTLAESNRS